MHQQDVTKSELCALYLFLKSDANISRERISPSHSNFEDRSYVRAVFAMFEGVTYAARQYILAQASAGKYQISTQERDLLAEQSFAVNKKGEIETKEIFLQFLPGFLLTIKVLGRCIGRGEYVAKAFGHHLYKNFQSGIAIRNKITHPRRTQEVILSQADIDTIKNAEIWFDTLLLELLGDAFKKHSEPTGK